MSRVRARSHVRREGGYTLIEMLVAMVILGIVLGGLTTVFVNGSAAELDLNRRFQAQQQARLALDKFRVDAHCATAAQAQTINTYPGVKLAVANCWAGTPTVSWCAVQVTAAPPRYQLYRTTSTTNVCQVADASRVLIADYLTTTTNITTATIPQYGLQTIAVDFKISVNATTTRDVYELTDAMVARNSTRCLTGGGCAVTPVP